MSAGMSHEEYHRDYTGAKLGMWLFLFSELVLFGGLFIAYAAMRARYVPEFHHASGDLNAVLGVTNTVVLLTSSLTMALAITAIQKGNAKLSSRLLTATIVLGCVFLVDKYFEWSHEIAKGLYPNSPVLMEHPPGERLFFGLYYTMTGLHGLHVIVGVILLSVMLGLLTRGKITSDDFVKLENSGLYWHLVDVIWIFLLPLFYLAA
jgi:cytochrome c oxidase subunit III